MCCPFAPLVCLIHESFQSKIEVVNALGNDAATQITPLVRDSQKKTFPSKSRHRTSHPPSTNRHLTPIYHHRTSLTHGPSTVALTPPPDMTSLTTLFPLRYTTTFSLAPMSPLILTRSKELGHWRLYWRALERLRWAVASATAKGSSARLKKAILGAA